MNLNGKKALIVGLGVSGLAAAKFLSKRGAEITITDSAPEKVLDSRLAALSGMDIRTEFGRHREETFLRADLIVVSPGVSHKIAPLERARRAGIEIIGEIELAARHIRPPIVAITGTNGKTTTTTLTAEMIRHSGFRVFMGGNIGNPLIEYVNQGEQSDILVVEVSSFQLDTITTFRPRVGVLLNITPDHLDRYPDFEAYAASKARLFCNQQAEDVAIINGSDPVAVAMCEAVKGKKCMVRREEAVEEMPVAGLPHAVVKDASVAIYDGASVFNLGLPHGIILGRHNLENIAAAALATLAVGGTPSAITAALKQFTGLSHRLEYVDSINGVRYFDDSKATNEDAVVKALDAFDTPVILILGGRSKGSDFHILEKPIRRHVKKLIIMGEAKDRIESALGNLVRSETVSSMEEAVASAHRSAVDGDVVLLSPACASFDMFKNYAERGDVFRRAVQRIKQENGNCER